jgi:uncharacterized protein
MIEQLKVIVKKIYDQETRNYHILLVLKKCTILLQHFIKADKDVVITAALLHDIGRMRYGGKNHHLTGISEAKKILLELECTDNFIDKVCHCIGAHSGKPDFVAETLEAEILMNADAMSHYDIIPSLIYWETEDCEMKEALQKLANKLSSNRDNKLSLPIAKEIVKDKHEAAMLLFMTNLEVITPLE